MTGLLTALGSIALLLLLVGLVKPRWVLPPRWKPNRLKAAGVYLGALVAFASLADWSLSPEERAAQEAAAAVQQATLAAQQKARQEEQAKQDAEAQKKAEEGRHLEAQLAEAKKAAADKELEPLREEARAYGFNPATWPELQPALLKISNVKKVSLNQAGSPPGTQVFIEHFMKSVWSEESYISGSASNIEAILKAAKPFADDFKHLRIKMDVPTDQGGTGYAMAITITGEKLKTLDLDRYGGTAIYNGIKVEFAGLGVNAVKTWCKAKSYRMTDNAEFCSAAFKW